MTESSLDWSKQGWILAFQKSPELCFNYIKWCSFGQYIFVWMNINDVRMICICEWYSGFNDLSKSMTMTRWYLSCTIKIKDTANH